MEDPREVIVRPVVSEKSYALSEKGVYIFVVPTATNKVEIRRSVEQVFNVKVTNVNTLNRPGKRKRNRRSSDLRQEAGHQAGLCDARDRPHDPAVRDQLRLQMLRSRKPTSAGRRFQTVSAFTEITTDRPERSLTVPKPSTGGRNAYGRITARHVGAGHKHQYRLVDFKRAKDDVPATVATIEYDPNRNARIALLHYHDGEKRYILAPSAWLLATSCAAGRALRYDPATRSPCALSPSVPSCTTSSSSPAAAANSPAAPVPACSWWPRRATLPRCGSRRPRCGGCRSTAAPR